VNDEDEAIGTMDKMEAHRKAALHRAFSVFIFNSRGEMLLQQRAENKYHSAGLWTNACCSHPVPGEDTGEGAVRRLKEEMGFTTELENLFSFTYRSAYSNGLTENEVDHVFAGIYDQEINPDRSEVKDYCFMNMESIAESLHTHPQKYTSWFHIAFPPIREWASERFGTIKETER